MGSGEGDAIRTFKWTGLVKEPTDPLSTLRRMIHKMPYEGECAESARREIVIMIDELVKTTKVV